jgi:predicted DNA-binding transcriptional regulator AlpA
MGHAESDAKVLGNTTPTPSAPNQILDVDGLPNLLDAKDVMDLLNVSRSSAYRLMADAGALRYGTAKNHSLRLPKTKLSALIATWESNEKIEVSA